MEVQMANMVTGIISLTIGVVLLSTFYISTIKATTTCVAGTLGANCNGTAGWGTNQTGVGGYGFTTGETALWGVLVLVGIAGMLYGVMNIFGLM